VKKYCFTFLFLFTCLIVFGQKKSVVDLIQSEHTEGVGKDLIKVYKGVFKQDFSILRSDSAYFYPKENSFDAFGHVNINQGDTLNIYSDKLNYNGNTKVAILTDHVRMVDKDATLYTNYLTYNTATRVGTYTGGGKLVNKDNTLTSKNGYYYAFTRDSYFRYNVTLVTVDALIKTDTLRYNTGTRIAYFYGPTDIYGTTGPKASRDTLYTENGSYNTVTEQAFFGKKNRYHQGTKSLKGDSLFYDKLKGFGKAVKNITFSDTEQKMILKGDLGTFYKADERTVVTQNAYGTLVTEETDTTKTDSASNRPAFKNKTDSVKSVAGQPSRIKASQNKDAKTINPAIVAAPQPAQVKKAVKAVKKSLNSPDTLKLPPPVKRKIKLDTIYYTADTLQTQILTFADLKILKENMRLVGLAALDTGGKLKLAVKKRSLKFLEILPVKGLSPDTSFLHRDYFGKPKPVIKKKQTVARKLSLQDSLRRARTDSVFMERKVELSDTARIRILSAFRHAKMFKSDLQAKADSIFYSNSDSTIRCYVHPLIWTQGSQLSGDTIYLQMKNKKLDNLSMFPNAFIANLEKGDSVNFNQSAGKKMRGFFYDGKLNRMFIEGNAETIYFNKDSLGKVSGMQRSLSSRIRINFKDGKVTDLTFFTKPENKYGPPGKLKEDDKILKGFIWKPKERPVSKESIIPSLNKKQDKAAIAAKGSVNDKKKTPVKKQTDKDKVISAIQNLLPGGQLPPGMNTDALKSKIIPAIMGKDSALKKFSLKNYPVPLPIKW
jgi:lipopolysaccharide export system protein LptA